MKFMLRYEGMTKPGNEIAKQGNSALLLKVNHNKSHTTIFSVGSESQKRGLCSNGCQTQVSSKEMVLASFKNFANYFKGLAVI